MAMKIDKYEVIEEIGRGGMGAVYKAVHPQFEKYVAIKEVRSDLAGNRDIQRKFEQEARLLAQLPPHPNIVTVRDALVADRQLYLVLDYIEGASLAELVQSGGIDPDHGARLIDEILSGLEVIHNRGIVHRDLKTSNILIDREGVAYISDFGIAEFVGAGGGAGTMATPKYAAPELIDPSLGRGGAEQQVDIYDAGIVAYEMLLGAERFREAFPEVYRGPSNGVAERWLRWHADLTRPAPHLSDIDPAIPRPLGGVIERMMTKDVNGRYRTVSEARRDLAACLDSLPDARGRRVDHAPEAATMPLDRLRKGGARSPSRFPSESGQRPPLVSPPGNQTANNRAAQPPKSTRGIPWWLWPLGSGLVMLAIGFVLFVVLSRNPGFVVIVRGAPPGADVFVDNVPRGVARPDGTVIVFSLESGKRLMRVSYEGYADFNTAVSGQDGETKSVIAQLAAVDTRPAVQAEIDYNGPMVLIQAGEFIMGDDNHQPNERPAHKVTLPDFYIDKFEVTNAQYKKFCEATGRPVPTNPFWDNQYFGSNPNSPVVGVNWHDAAGYAKWVGKRLPTEKEWEKAASWGPEAREKRQWPWGDNPDSNRVSLGGNRPPVVGQQAPSVSAYGVHDLAGSVAEWVDSFYQPYSGNQTPDANFGTRNEVVRGGHFRSGIEDVRTTARYYNPPEFSSVEKKERTWLIGFRCAVSADDPRLQAMLTARR